MLEGSPAQQKIDPSLIKQRIREARLKAGYDEEGLAEAIGVDARTIRRWENLEPGPDSTMPKISEAAKLLIALPITLDWLVGIDMTTEDVVRTVTARVGFEVDAITKKLDMLMKELAAARDALKPTSDAVDESELDVSMGSAVIGRKKRAE